MPVIVNCPFCEAKYNLPDRLRGRRVKCRKCGNKFNTDDPSGEHLGGQTQDLAAVSDASFDFRPASTGSEVDVGDVPPPPPPPASGSSATASDFLFESPPPPPASKGGNESDYNIEVSELARALAGDVGLDSGEVGAAPNIPDDDDRRAPESAAPPRVELPNLDATATDSQGIRPYRADSIRNAYESGQEAEYGGTGQFDSNQVVADAAAMIANEIDGPRIPPLPPRKSPSAIAPATTATGGYGVGAGKPAPHGPAAPTPILFLGLFLLIGLVAGGAYFIVNNPLAPSNRPGNPPAIEVPDGLNALDAIVAEGALTPISAVNRYENYLAQSRLLNAEFAIRQQALALAMEFSTPSPNANANAPENAVWLRYQKSAEQYLAFIGQHSAELAGVRVEQGDTVTTEGEVTLTATVHGQSLDIAVGIAAPQLVPSTAKFRYTLAKIGNGWHVRERVRLAE